MKSTLLFSLPILILAGCGHFNQTITETYPLHETLDELKSELRIFNSTLQAADLKLKCGGEQDLKISFTEIEVTISTENGNTVEGSALLRGSREQNEENTLVITFAPQDIPAATPDDQLNPDGIAKAILDVSNQLSQVNSNGPCLELGETTYTANFTIEKSAGVGVEFSVGFIDAEGSAVKTSGSRNQIKVTFNFGGAALVPS